MPLRSCRRTARRSNCRRQEDRPEFNRPESILTAYVRGPAFGGGLRHARAPLWSGTPRRVLRDVFLLKNERRPSAQAGDKTINVLYEFRRFFDHREMAAVLHHP